MKHIPLSILLVAAALKPALAQDSQQQFEDDAAAAFETAIEDYDIPGLCCTNQVDGGVTPSPDGFIPQLP